MQEINKVKNDLKITDKNHKHHGVFKQWLQLAAASPESLPVMQYKFPEDKNWHDCTDENIPYLAWDEENQYRIKPKTLLRPAVEVPAPMTTRPAFDAVAYFVSPEKVYNFNWAGDKWQECYFKSGLVYSDKELAEACWKAMYPAL